MRILAMTVCCVDIYPEQRVERVGGEALNFATQCRRSGAEHVAILGAVGNDHYGTAVLQHLETMGIESSHLYRQEGDTATHIIHISPDGERYFLPDSWRGGVYQEFRLSEEDWTFANTHDLAAIISLDPNFLEATRKLSPTVKLVVDFLDTSDFELLESCLPRIDIAFLSGDPQAVERAQVLAQQQDAFIVVTLGSEGSVVLRGRQKVFQPALPVERVADTTGCGDSFQAAFAISWFKEYDLAKALAAGAQAAAQVLSHLGGA